MSITSQTVGLAVGWLMVGGVGLQTLASGFRAWRRNAAARERYDAERAELRRRIEAAARAARATWAIAEWEGFREFRVAAIVDEAVHVKSFYLTPLDGRPLAPFAPGQYLTFRLPLPEPATPLVRCYSLSAGPREDYYRCTIKRVAPPVDQLGLPPGRGSNFFHESVEIGDVLQVRAPAGTFLLDPQSTDPVALVGAGIGVTPLVAMLEAIVRGGCRREVYLLLGFRNSRDHPFKEHLQKLAAEYPAIRLQVSYSAPLATDVLGKDYHHRGRVTIDRLRDVLPSNNFNFYVCGPGSMMDSLVPALWDWGVPQSHVWFEAFGPASVTTASGRTAGTMLPVDIQFLRSGRSATWDGSFASLLELGEASGVPLPSGCRAGSCGECMTAVTAGAVRTLKTPGVPVPPGHCLTCVSVPAEALALDA